MSLLFLLTGALLALSGALKVRASARVGGGLPILSLLEILLAVVACLAGIAFAATGGPAGGSLGWVVPGGVALMLVSSFSHALRMRSLRRQRKETEAARLATYVKYLSRSNGDSE